MNPSFSTCADQYRKIVRYVTDDNGIFLERFIFSQLIQKLSAEGA
jgi:hypothetical protein